MEQQKKQLEKIQKTINVFRILSKIAMVASEAWYYVDFGINGLQIWCNALEEGR